MARMKAPEKRQAIAYWYIKESNRVWLEKKARELGMTRSACADFIMDQARKHNPLRRGRPASKAA